MGNVWGAKPEDVPEKSPPPFCDRFISKNDTNVQIEVANEVHIGDKIVNCSVPCEKDHVSDCEQKENEERFMALLKQSDCSLIQLFPWDTEHKYLDKVYVHPKISEEDHQNDYKSLEDIVSSLRGKNSNSPRILIYGDPGIGKSTLAKKLMWDWASDKDYIKAYKFVIHIELTQALFNLKNLNEIIINQLSNKFDADTGCVSLFLENNKKKILFLLDGPEDIAKCHVEIFEKFFKKYPLAPVILFSRPIPNDIWTTKRWFCNRFYVSGFDESCAKLFNEKFFQFKSDKNTFDLTQLHVCDSLSRIPLFCYFRCNFFHQKKEVLCTITQIYDAVFKMYCHHYQKNVALGNAVDEDIIPENIKDALKCVGGLIFRCLMKENLHITPARLQTHCGNENATIIRGLGIFREEQYKTDGQRVYYIQPTHPTFLDYLVAFYITHLEKPDDQIEHILERLPLLHSKSYRSLGSRASLIVILLCGRLKSQAHVLFNKIATKYLYKNFHEKAFLIWEASEGGHFITRAFKAADQLLQKCVPEKWDLQWLFVKNRKSNSLNISILENILMRENCPLKTYRLDLMSLYLLHGAEKKVNPYFRRFLNALEKNSSIVEFEFEKDHKTPDDLLPEICIQIYRKIFMKMKSMHKIIHISFNTDVFIKNAKLNFTILKDLFVCLNEMTQLQTLKITASINLKNKLCNSFHDELSSNNTQASKKRSKTVTIEDTHIKELVESFTNINALGELYLSQVRFSSQHTVETFCSLVQASSLKRLSLTEMTCTNNLDLSATLRLIIENIGPNVCHLDLQGTEFTNGKALIAYMTKNTVLKSLNLANCLKDEGLIQGILSASSKSNIKKINLCSDKVEITDNTILGFCQSSPFETFIASGWKYKINKQKSLLILKKFLQQSPLKLLCLSNSLIEIDLQIHKTICETDLQGWLINMFSSESNIHLLDIQNVQVKIALHLCPELVNRNDSVDSGFHSPTRESDSKHLSFIEDEGSYHLPHGSGLKALSKDPINWDADAIKKILSGLNFKICVNNCNILEYIAGEMETFSS